MLRQFAHNALLVGYVQGLEFLQQAQKLFRLGCVVTALAQFTDDPILLYDVVIALRDVRFAFGQMLKEYRGPSYEL